MPLSRPLRRSAGLLLLLAGLVGCDTSGPSGEPASLDPADLVGTWTLSEYTDVTRVTSAINQTVALTHEAGVGGVTVSGIEGPFRYLGGASTDSLSQTRGFILTPVARVPEHPGYFTRLWVASRTDGSYFLQLYTEDSRYAAVTEAGDPAFTLNGGGLTVPARTLTNANGETVTVGGEVAFSTRDLRAGEATDLPTAYPVGFRSGGYDAPYIARITFAEDGTFTADGGARVDGRPLEGTWASPAPGRATATYVFEWGTYVEEYTFAVSDDALTLEHAPGPYPDVPSLQALSYLAEPGSFASYQVVGFYRFAAAD